MKYFLLSFLLFTCFNKAFCQAGKLDNSFGNNGKVTTLVGTTSTTGNAVAIQSNGKIVVAGDYYNGSHNNNDFAVVRYNTEGTLDNSFAGNGKAGIDFGGDDYGTSTAIQSNGYIVVIGHSYTYSPAGNYFIAARLTTSGTLDPSFGNGGKVKISFRGQMRSAAIQADGKIVVAGDSGIDNSKDFALFRLNSNGSLDNSFGIGGEVFTAFSGINDEGYSVAVQSNGKILAGGFTYRNGEQCFAIARYNSNGLLDASFGGDGRITTAVGSTGAGAFAMAVQSNGKIFQAGQYIDNKGYAQFAVVKYNTDGTLDNSFAGNGKAAVSFNGGGDATSINIQTDGKIVLAGINTVTNNADFALARLTKTGSLDNSFGNAGTVITGFGGNDYGTSSAIQADGKIVVAGLSVTDKYRIAVARYLGSGSSSNVMNEENVTVIKPAILALLAQNIPNPFSNTTTINYVLPQTYSSAKIIVTDKMGNTLKQINLSGSKGSINVDATTLSSGAYQYSLYVDGRLIDTKQMVLTK